MYWIEWILKQMNLLNWILLKVSCIVYVLSYMYDDIEILRVQQYLEETFAKYLQKSPTVPICSAKTVWPILSSMRENRKGRLRQISRQIYCFGWKGLANNKSFATKEWLFVQRSNCLYDILLDPEKCTFYLRRAAQGRRKVWKSQGASRRLGPFQGKCFISISTTI